MHKIDKNKPGFDLLSTQVLAKEMGPMAASFGKLGS